MSQRQPKVISLFTGAGGLDIGFHAAGLATAVAVEMDRRSCETLNANKRRGYDWEVIQRRVEEVPSNEILAAARLRVGDADALIGGPPCQPFSKSGYWARGDSSRLRDPRANTLAEFVRILRDTQPKTFLLENVSGLAYTGKEEGFRYLFEEIERVNAATGSRYKISAKVLNAAWYGVPQTRERIILVGSRDGRPFRFPEPRFHDSEIQKQEELLGDRAVYRTAWDALGDLAAPEDLAETRVTGRWASLLPTIPEGMNYLHHTNRGDGLSIFGWRRRYWSFLLKLSKRRPAWTLTAQPGPAIGPFHWQNRRLARTELLRLQTFPDGYSVEGALPEVQRQLGNAVPSALGEVLALEIRRQLLDEKLSSMNPSLVPLKRSHVPAPEPTRRVPRSYLPLVGEHEEHPGTGLGYAAQRRANLAASS